MPNEKFSSAGTPGRKAEHNRSKHLYMNPEIEAGTLSDEAKRELGRQGEEDFAVAASRSYKIRPLEGRFEKQTKEERKAIAARVRKERLANVPDAEFEDLGDEVADEDILESRLKHPSLEKRPLTRGIEIEMEAPDMRLRALEGRLKAALKGGHERISDVHAELDDLIVDLHRTVAMGHARHYEQAKLNSLDALIERASRLKRIGNRHDLTLMEEGERQDALVEHVVSKASGPAKTRTEVKKPQGMLARIKGWFGSLTEKKPYPGSMLRDAAASILVGVETSSEKQARELEEKEGLSIAPQANSMEEFESSFMGPTEEEQAEAAQRARLKAGVADVKRRHAEKRLAAQSERLDFAVPQPTIAERAEKMRTLTARAAEQVKLAAEARRRVLKEAPMEVRSEEPAQEGQDETRTYRAAVRVDDIPPPPPEMMAKVAQYEEDTARINEENRQKREFRKKAAAGLRQSRETLPQIPVETGSQEPKVILSPEVQEDVENMEMGKKQLDEVAAKAKERRAKLEAARGEMVHLARTDRTDPSMVNELNAKTDNLFFADAKEEWDKAYAAVTKGLERAGEQKIASDPVALATEYVMRKAKLKAAELSGMDAKELSKLRKALEDQPAAYFLRSGAKRIELPKPDNDLPAASASGKMETVEARKGAKRRPNERMAQKHEGQSAELTELEQEWDRLAADAAAKEDAKVDVEEATETPRSPAHASSDKPARKSKAEEEYEDYTSRAKAIPGDAEVDAANLEVLKDAKLDRLTKERDARRAQRQARKERADKAEAERQSERRAETNKVAEDELLRLYAIGNLDIDDAEDAELAKKQKQQAVDLVNERSKGAFLKEAASIYEAAEKAGRAQEAEEHLNALARLRAAEDLKLGKDLIEFLRLDTERTKALLEGRPLHKKGKGKKK